MLQLEMFVVGRVSVLAGQIFYLVIVDDIVESACLGIISVDLVESVMLGPLCGPPSCLGILVDLRHAWASSLGTSVMLGHPLCGVRHAWASLGSCSPSCLGILSVDPR